MAAVVGFDLESEHQVVVLAPYDFIDRDRNGSRCVEGFFAIDGTEDVKGYTILQLGIQDCRHRYQAVAYALISTGEGKDQVHRFLDILDSKVRELSHDHQGLHM